MTGVELHYLNIKFVKFWNAGHDACLTVQCWAGKATINLINPRRQTSTTSACFSSATSSTTTRPFSQSAPWRTWWDSYSGRSWSWYFRSYWQLESNTAAVNTADDFTLKKPTGDWQMTLQKKILKLKHSRSPLVNCLLTLLIMNLSISLFHLVDWLVIKKGLKKLWWRIFIPKVAV